MFQILTKKLGTVLRVSGSVLPLLFFLTFFTTSTEAKSTDDLTACAAGAGTLVPLDGDCLIDGSADLVAGPLTAPVVPTGFIGRFDGERSAN
ncbi:MAG: hypothetical protein GYB31_11760 [Bacteroidetes bacterium]|nr:hypothetical protein [Bacteroidota bacterium]